MAVIGAVILVVVVGGGLLGRSALLNSWYVGASGDEVAIFRGVPGSILGLHVSELEQRTGVRIASLVEIEQERVRDGKTADTRAEAEEIVRHLQRAPVAPPAVVPTAPPSPEPSPLPETPPA
jgi:protein phosphatase